MPTRSPVAVAQLRGRVGRGRERAYAYFLYAADKPLTETAHERLSTIAQHTELGSGMHIAMKDLEIRGAGNLLGGEQSGHIADVGFDLYVRLVGEALAEYRDEPSAAPNEVKVELPIDAHIPADYLPHERLRRGVQAAGRRRSTPLSTRWRQNCSTGTAPCPRPSNRCWRWSLPGAGPVGRPQRGRHAGAGRLHPVELPLGVRADAPDPPLPARW